MTGRWEARRKRTASLICFNLRREWIGQDQGWVAPAELVLRHARERAWRIAHAYVQAQPDRSEVGALPGLEPRLTEPVFAVSGVTPFDSETFRQWISDRSGRLYLVGGVYGLAGAATVVGAQVLKVPLTLVNEACGLPREAEAPSTTQMRARIDGLTRAARLADIVGRRQSSNVVQLTRRRRTGEEQ